MATALSLWRLPPVWFPGIVRMWKRDALLYKRSWKRNVLPNFFEPLLYLLSIGLGLGVYVGRKILGVDYADFIAPGLLAAAAMNGAVFETTFNVFVKLRFAKLYDAVITTPLEPEDVAAGELLWGVTRSVIYGVAFLVVMGALGYIHYWAFVFAPLAAALVGLAFGLIGLVFTALTPTIDLFSYFFTLFITPLFLFSGLFFPTSRLGAAEPVAWFSPLNHGAELMRGLILTGDLTSAAGHALWLVVFCALIFPPAINLMRRRLVT